MQASDPERGEQGSATEEKLNDRLDLLVSWVREDASLAHILPILIEAQKAAAKSPEFSHDDIVRVADLVMNLPGVSSIEEAIGRARILEGHAQPNMFARAVSVELERRREG